MTATSLTTVELCLPSQLGFEKSTRTLVEWIGVRLGIDANRIADLQTAVCEACINAIEHGNRNEAQRQIRVTFTYGPDYLDAVVADEGLNRYRPSSRPPATMAQKVAGLAPARGMGLMLIPHLVDESGFLPLESGRGNRYWLRMYRTRPARKNIPVDGLMAASTGVQSAA